MRDTVDPRVSPYLEAHRRIRMLRNAASSYRSVAERFARLLERGLEEEEIWDFQDPLHLFRLADSFECQACSIEAVEVGWVMAKRRSSS